MIAQDDIRKLKLIRTVLERVAEENVTMRYFIHGKNACAIGHLTRSPEGIKEGWSTNVSVPPFEEIYFNGETSWSAIEEFLPSLGVGYVSEIFRGLHSPLDIPGPRERNPKSIMLNRIDVFLKQHT